MTRGYWLLPLLALVAGCSEKSETTQSNANADLKVAAESAPSVASDAAGMAAEQPPAIDANIAPGVAFDYRYAFSLPEQQIARVQEEHAALCGRLGQGNCRVTSLTFNKARNGDIDAKMGFLLNPALALRFARDATDLVARADGKLETSSVNGNDVGSAIVAGDKTSASLKSEIAKIEAQLKIPNLSKDVRSRLVDQLSDLRSQIRAIAADRDDKVESLATTPVQFDYEAGETVLGMGRNAPLRQGWAIGGESFGAMTAMLAMLVGAVGPWALLGAGIWWIVRRLRRQPVTSE